MLVLQIAALVGQETITTLSPTMEDLDTKQE